MTILTEPEQHKKWSSIWANNDRFFAGRLEKFNILDQHLESPPATILDIGCGLAVESELFQKKYGCDLYLLDGDSNKNSSNQVRDIDYGDANSMQFYLTREYLEQQWQARGMRYQFVDASNPVLDPNLKFDLIYSSKSCGFHYPLSTYKDLIAHHSHANTVIIIDLRKPYLVHENAWFTIEQRIIEWNKGITAQVSFEL